MADNNYKERDVILAGNEFAYVQDMTKGDVNMYVGPTKFSLSNTERLVTVNPKTKRITPEFDSEGRGQGVQPFIFTESSQYVVVENPVKDKQKDQENYTRGPNSPKELEYGKKVVKAGPATFPLWPGQVATVINGHQLREDQYLVTRVYDKSDEDSHHIGEEKIVKGTDVKFFVPETGWEVVSENGQHVRSAVKLQDAEYCVLSRPDGSKKYVSGPTVVFPEAGESFVNKPDGAKNFNAVKLRKERGLHLYVSKDFEVSKEDDVADKTLVDLIGEGKFNVGQELFVAGKEGLFFPSENLEVRLRLALYPFQKMKGYTYEIWFQEELKQ